MFLDLRHSIETLLPRKCVAFDLGGTLFERDPLHVRASIEAMRLCTEDEKSIATQVIEEELRLGGSSRSFLMAVMERLEINTSLLDEVVARKRVRLRELQGTETLIGPARDLLTWLAAETDVFIVSQGAIDESQQLLQRTYECATQPRPEIQVLGRATDRDEVDKYSMLAAACGRQPSACLFIGDSEHDQLAAERLGVPFIHFSPFRTL
ncbi:HAD family hydrolase [Ornithinimicrobium avium]|uniref:HAD family hydrolase n=1 Tax=Ornithinimicrobium avium TaxID=2283195 RepID=UPI0013B44410|nr:HAD family hydrolase [Ornithinimicrobium avium]